jgi:UDPglucose 6-dehydrogenase
LLAGAGHKVSGIDLSPDRINDIYKLQVEPEPDVEKLLATVLNKNLSLHSNFESALDSSEVSFLIVPTPSNEEGRFINNFLEDAISKILKSCKVKEHLICIVSTVMPGSCDYFIDSYIPSNIGDSLTQFQLAYSPEFVALGTVIKNMRTPDMILIGAREKKSFETLESIQKSIVSNNPAVKCLSLASAELAKIAVNTFVTSKISYANMIAELAERIPGADKYEVLQALGADSRIGGKYLQPGLGFGGPCFPRDNKAFAALGDSLKTNTEIAIATNSINLRQPEIIAQRINSKFLGRFNKVTVLGLSYKPGSFVTEESQAIMLIRELGKVWRNINVHDPLVKDKELFMDFDNVVFIDDTQEIRDEDLVVLAVNWPVYSKLQLSHPKENFYLI